MFDFLRINFVPGFIGAAPGSLEAELASIADLFSFIAASTGAAPFASDCANLSFFLTTPLASLIFLGAALFSGAPASAAAPGDYRSSLSGLTRTSSRRLSIPSSPPSPPG